jgi:hypothetical protein
VEVLGRGKTSLASLRRAAVIADVAVLTRPARFPRMAFVGAAGNLGGKDSTMWHGSLTPSITVTIGRHTRLYFAFVTTAPTALDSPATVTLYAATFSDVVGFAADPVTHDKVRGRGPARLVLIDAMELAWQRAKYRGNEHLLLPADPGLVGLNTLQHWLWQRLQAPLNSQVAA